MIGLSAKLGAVFFYRRLEFALHLEENSYVDVHPGEIRPEACRFTILAQCRF